MLEQLIKGYEARVRHPLTTIISIDPPKTTEVDQGMMPKQRDVLRLAMTIPACTDFIPRDGDMEMAMRDAGQTLYRANGSRKTMMPPKLGQLFSLRTGDTRPGITIEVDPTADPKLTSPYIYRSEVLNVAELNFSQADSVLAGSPNETGETLKVLLDMAVVCGQRQIQQGGIMWDSDRGIGMTAGGELLFEKAGETSTSFLIVRHLITHVNKTLIAFCERHGIPFVGRNRNRSFTSPLRRYGDYFGLRQLMDFFDGKPVIKGSNPRENEFFKKTEVVLLNALATKRNHKQQVLASLLNKSSELQQPSNPIKRWRGHEAMEAFIAKQQELMLPKIINRLRQGKFTAQELIILRTGLHRQPQGWEDVQREIDKVI